MNNKNLPLRFGAVATVALVAACYSPSVVAVEALRITFQNRCPLSGAAPFVPQARESGLEALLGTIGIQIAQGVIGGAVDAVVEIMEPDDVSYPARTTIDAFYSATNVNATQVGCMIAAVGDFGKPKSDVFDDLGKSVAWQNGQAPGPTEPASALATARRFFLNRVPLSARPSFYFEAVLSVSPDRTAFTYRPVVVVIDQSYSRHFFAPAQRSYSFGVDLKRPSSASFASFKYAFGPVVPPLAKGWAEGDRATAWTQLAEASDTAGAQNSATGPLNVEALLVESSTPNLVVKAVIDSVKANKGAIKDTATDALIGNYKARMQVAQLDAATGALSAYRVAKANATAKCTDVGSDTQKIDACTKAQVTAATAKARASQLLTAVGLQDLLGD